MRDGGSALERAQAFGAQPFRGLVGPNEREIPAVRAPDGSLIYLVEEREPGQTIYDSDFVLDPQAAPAGNLQRIDHMAMALPADSLDSWVLFYKSVLDFEADDEVVLPDPYGLVKSRAIRSRCSSVRLPLNISENRNTAISHALSSYRGSGVHHIAFACEDIFAEVARAKEAGVPLLEIPLNYYDDLAARFDFDDEFLSELAYYNVLYDRDAQGGELFHVYSEPFEGRFFFEIIQRRNGYVGYGAANVAVRLAAMAKARSGATRPARL
ncbi:4-hydroxyphenylpyruvate dioxygenase [compost metagenome]